MGGTAMSQVRARQEIRCTFCCWPAGRSPEGRGGGRASPALPLLDDATTSPASRRLASARPALAPKCTPYFLTGPKLPVPFQGARAYLGKYVGAFMKSCAE